MSVLDKVLIYWGCFVALYIALRMRPASQLSRLLLPQPWPKPIEREPEWRFGTRLCTRAFQRSLPTLAHLWFFYWVFGDALFHPTDTWAYLLSGMLLVGFVWVWGTSLFFGCYSLWLRHSTAQKIFDSTANKFVMVPNQPLHPDALTRAGERRR